MTTITKHHCNLLWWFIESAVLSVFPLEAANTLPGNYTGVKNICVNYDSGDCHFKRSTEGDEIRVLCKSSGVVVTQDGDTLNISRKKSGFFSWFSTPMMFIIYVPDNIHQVTVSLGKGKIVVDDNISNKLEISGGSVAITATNLRQLNCSAGEAKVDLKYENFTDKPVKLNFEAGALQLKIEVDSFFRHFCNKLKGPNITVNSKFPATTEGGDLIISGSCGTATIGIYQN